MRWRRRGKRDAGGSPIGTESRNGGRIVVFAPSPILTITVESGPERPEVHLHAGGQGFWVARLAATLGADVVFCCALAGEPGRVLRGLVEAELLELRAATGVGLARGMDMLESLQLGMAAGALNATRRGLGTGTKQEIEHLARHVTIRPLAPHPPHPSAPPPGAQT